MARRVSVYAVLIGLMSIDALATPDPKPEFHRAVAFGVSPAVRDLPPQTADTLGPKRDIEAPKNPPLPRIRENASSPSSPDAAVSQIQAPDVMPAIILQLDGVSNQDNFNSYGGRVAPPDTNMDVGPNHLVQTVNLLVRIWNKAGVPAGPPFRMSQLFASIGGVCANNDDGDPIVLYDQLADRWLISQFSFPSFPNPPYYQCVAISSTGDPTGTYYAYEFIVPNANLNDYPHFGVWPDAYYMTVNQFINAGPFNGTGAFAFDRSKMLAGDPDAGFVYFNLDLASHPEGIGGTLPSDADGPLPPPVGAPNIVGYFLANEFGDALDGIRLFNFHVDFDVPASSTFTERVGSPLPVAAFDPINPAGADVPQPTTLNRLDGITDRFMHRLQYRNYGTHESWVTNHTVDASGDPTPAVFRAGVRYYELRRTGAVASPLTIHEQATHSPDTVHRWMGSAALDANGNMAVGFSASDAAAVMPSIRYAGRLAGDAPGSLAQGEATMIAGTGVQTTTTRWGDYSMMAVDPVDDCTFWYTTEYYTAASQAVHPANWLTRMGSFKYPTCSAPAVGAVEVNVTNCDTLADIPGASVQMSGFFRTTDAGGQGLITGVAPGSYTVEVSLPGYPTVTAPAVVTGGNTTVVNVCLDPTAILAEGAGNLVSESCAPPNSAPDPGETVTVSLCVTNNGSAPTVNLVGTLQTGGGVTNPSAPQNYAAVAAGATVCRDFTFDVSALCGDIVEADLQLQDGVTNYGTFTYEFRVGVLSATPTFSQSFDTVAAPALPAGWATAFSGSGIAWVTSTTNPDTAPNAAFEPNATTTGEASLTSPVIAITTDSARLSFRHTYNTENNFDGGVLEIKIGAGAFQDILAAGGSFLGGAYDDGLANDGTCPNPLGGRQAWNGVSAYKTTTVNLPAAAQGQNVQLRWRFGTDCSVAPSAPNGWRVDTIALRDGYTCCLGLSLVPTSLKVDEVAAPGSTGNLNRVWEPGEIVVLQMGWTLTAPAPQDITGTASNLTGPVGATYGLPDAAADYGTVANGGVTDCAGADCYQTSVDDPAVRPGAPWTATVLETMSMAPAIPTGTGIQKTWSLHIGDSFTDAPPGSFGYRFIETLFKNGVTSGCGAGIFCPGTNVPREQMAVFLLVSKEGAGYVPPDCTVPMFTDVPCSSGFAKWINELANPARAITSGCGGGNFCPADPVTREQMAVFLLRTLEGPTYTPVDCVTPQFDDVPCSSGFAKWINELADRGITSGCNVTPPLFCPTTPVTRAQMSIFLTATFGLTLYGP